MVGAVRVLVDRQRALVQRLGLGEISLTNMEGDGVSDNTPGFPFIVFSMPNKYTACKKGPALTPFFYRQRAGAVLRGRHIPDTKQRNELSSFETKPRELCALGQASPFGEQYNMERITTLVGLKISLALTSALSKPPVPMRLKGGGGRLPVPPVLPLGR